jgi:predicted methyltransferase
MPRLVLLEVLMGSPSSSIVRWLAGLLVALAPAFAIAGGPASPEAREEGQGLDPVATAVAAPTRAAVDRARDPDRRPDEVLRFCGVSPGKRIGELMAGRGYYTEILSAAVGPTGEVFAHNSPFVLERFAAEPFGRLLERLPLDNVTRLDAVPEKPGLPSGLDVVILIRFYHDFYWQDVDRAAVNRAVLEALAPGGVFCVLDHHAEEGSGDRDVSRLHRVDAAMVKKEVLAAGFEWDGESNALCHPEDDRTWSIFVDDGARNDKTDRFLFRFRKPRD